MDPFFTIDERTTRRTARRSSDPVRDLTRPVHGTGSDRPELIQSIRRFNKAESKAFEDFLDSRKANSGDDGWDLHKVEVEFLSYFKTAFPAGKRLPLIGRRSMAALLRARAAKKVRRLARQRGAVPFRIPFSSLNSTRVFLPTNKYWSENLQTFFD